MREYPHGGDIYTRTITYDFSANINPLGMPERVRQVLASSIECYEHYPDSRCTKLVDAIWNYETKDSHLCDVIGKEQIVCGNGAAELIYRIVQVLQPKKALLPVPSFMEYEAALREENCEIQYHYLKDEQMFDSTEAVLEDITEGMDLLFLCNPNNPVGNTIPEQLMEQILEKCDRCGVTVVVDECFLEFTQQGEQKSVKKYFEQFKRLIVLKAFTKTFAMAGLRLGYALCADREMADNIRQCGQCWNVSVPAQLAGVEALQEVGYLEQTRQYVAVERTYLTNQLKRMGLQVFEPEANYIFFFVPEERYREDLESRLLMNQIAIRNCSNYEGLDRGYYRIAVRTHEENEVLVRCLEQIMEAER